MKIIKFYIFYVTNNAAKILTQKVHCNSSAQDNYLFRVESVLQINEIKFLTFFYY